MTGLSEDVQKALAANYRIERELGRGGMATVWLAHDLRHNRSVALKVLDRDSAAAIGPERFAREIEVTAHLQHPNVLPVFDSGAAGDTLWYTMPLVEGDSLRKRMDGEKQLPLDDVVRIARGVADALDYAHDKSVVHRDVKPENILLSHGQAVLADFGIARATAAGQLTQAGLVLGTPTYMSPEQASGEQQLNGRSDVYALGCVVYEMLAGEPPFAGQSAQSIVAKHLGAPVPSLRTLRPDLSAQVDGAIRKALAKPAVSRFATAGKFVDALERSSRPAAISRRVMIGAAAIVLALIGAAWFSARSSFFGHPRPVVLLMDSPNPARVYDSTTLAANGTNADVLSDVLADLPIRTQKEAIGPSWHREDELLLFNPDLILIHFSGFCQAECTDRTRLKQVVETFAATDTKFVIYSRAIEDSLRVKVDSLLHGVETAHPGTLHRVNVFGLLSHGSPHWRDPVTASALKLRVKEILELK